MTKAEMKRAVNALIEIHLDKGLPDLDRLAKKYNVNRGDIDEYNSRLEWILLRHRNGCKCFAEYCSWDTGVECSLLLSEVCRKDFYYQETEC